ncbi:peptidoglycan DD-metalloendopeptidase family protein [Shewanella sp.]|uniref:peptidoglycan DD-metalloendopeptidase family protein n=1 Tax=Shewanella sp. TaxID=50422 RepID=UPI0035624FE2
MAKLTLMCLFLLLFAGCSLQSHQPAPVESATSKKKPAHPRGSLTSSSYTVKKGDTLYSIAWGAGTDYQQIAKINQLNKPYTIYPGQVLKLTANTRVANKSSTKGSVKDQSSGQRNGSKYVNKHNVNESASEKELSRDLSKKTLDPKNKADYAVTSSQQKANRSITDPEGLPEEVTHWLWPAKGRLVGTFSAREQGTKGIKIAGRRGDPIRAAAEGRVVYAGNALRGYGNLVIIKHSDEFLSAYAHLDKILVVEKQKVSPGQTIAKMGNTDAEQVMLYFEIRLHGVSVNPQKYLPKQ